MKRVWGIARLVATFALLGLATTVAVAWTLAAWLPHRSLLKRIDWVFESDLGEAGRPNYMVFTSEFSRPGMARRGWHAHHTGLDTHGIVSLGELYPVSRDATDGGRSIAQLRASWGSLPIRGLAVPRQTDESYAFEDARGWPCLALWCELRIAKYGPPGFLWTADGGHVLDPSTPRSAGEVRALPLRPIWAGLAVNTVAYGGAWCALVYGAVLARLCVRRVRGRCPRCGYDLVGDLAGGCPECGWGRPSEPCA